MLAARDLAAADHACRELERIAHELDTELLEAIAAQARGSVELAEGDAQAALRSLGLAFELWQRADAPYAAARVRVLLGKACRVLGDEDGAELAINAARAVFERLGVADAESWFDPRPPIDRARAAGASPRRDRQDEQGRRCRAAPEREDH
jgi:hypothetical protein